MRWRCLTTKFFPSWLCHPELVEELLLGSWLLLLGSWFYFSSSPFKYFSNFKSLDPYQLNISPSTITILDWGNNDCSSATCDFLNGKGSLDKKQYSGFS